MASSFLLAEPRLELIVAPIVATCLPVDQNGVRIEFDLSMTISNASNENVLLLWAEKPIVVAQWIGTSTDGGRTISSSLGGGYGGPSLDTSQKWRDLARRVRRAPIAESGLLILTPGQTVSLESKSGFGFPETEWGGMKKDEMPFREIVKQKSLWMTFVLQTWHYNVSHAGGGDSFPRKIAKARADYGQLQTLPLTSTPTRLTIACQD